MMIINKKFLKSLKPCIDRWKNYLEHHDSWSGNPLEFLELDKISDEDKLWVCLRPEIVPEKQLHLLACTYAESVLHLFEEKYPDNKCPRLAIEAKRKWVNGEISDRELAAARDAARTAGWAARDAARYAGWAAGYAARDAARAAAGYAAQDAAWAARAAGYAVVKKQVEQLKECLIELGGRIPRKIQR